MIVVFSKTNHMRIKNDICESADITNFISSIAILINTSPWNAEKLFTVIRALAVSIQQHYILEHPQAVLVWRVLCKNSATSACTLICKDGFSG